MIHILLNSFEYVSQAPNFYGSMGVVSALGMFVGALIYKGQIEAVLKAVLVVASYAILLVWVNLSRVFALYKLSGDIDRDKQAFASTLTIMWVSFAWILGLILGVLIIRYRTRFTR